MNARSNPAANNHAEHFEKLGRERDALLQTASGTDCQRENSVQRLEQLRATQKKLSDEMHTTQGNLGVIHREYAMWKNEKGRLQNVLETERVQLEQCSEESKALQVDQSKHKREFCKAMEALNTELNDLLMQQEDIRMQKMISVESVPALLEYFRKKELTQSQDSEEAKASLLDCLQMAVDTLKTATVRYLNQSVIKNELEDSVQMLRARALVTSDKDDSQKNMLTETSLVELETVWEQDWDESGGNAAATAGAKKGDATGKETPHLLNLELFYGPPQHKGAGDTSPVMDSDSTKASF